MPNTIVSGDLNIRNENNEFVTIYPNSVAKNISTKFGRTISVEELLKLLSDYIEVANDTARFALTSTDVRLGTLVYVISSNSLYSVDNLSSLNSSSGYTALNISNVVPSIQWDRIRNKPSTASQSANGFMSSSDKTKLDGIATGANKTIIDTALNTTSTNPVQNKVINTALAGKANSSHTHAQTDITGLSTSLAGKANSSHSHAQTDITGLEDALAGKANSSHSHSVASQSVNGFMSSTDKTKLDGIATGANKTTIDTTLSTTSTNPVQNKVINTALAGKANSSHSHAQTDITGLVDALAGKAPSSHNHSASNITSGTLPIARGGTGATDAATARTNLGITLANIGAAASSHSHAQTDITGLSDALDGKANSSHSHAQTDITGLSDALAGKANSSHTHSAASQSVNGFMSSSDKTKLDGIATGATNTVIDTTLSTTSTNPVQNKVINTALAGKANSSHNHSASNITSGTLSIARGGTGATDAATARTNLGITLANIGAAASSHSHAQTDITGLVDALAGKAASSHSHAQSDITGLSDALDGKANSSHSHAQSDITGLSTSLAGKANSSHSHAQTDITGLADALAGKAASSHSHSVASQSANGFMSSGDKTKLDGIATGATKVIIDTALSASSTNPVQNKVINTALAGKAASSHSHAQTDITGLVDALAGKAASSHSHSVASQSANGFMSSGDKTKLDGIATGATNTVIDTALNTTSTNPVQNKVINTALAGKANSSHSHSVSDITSGTLPIARGGTGATDAATARTNLGITLANIGAAASSHSHSVASQSANGFMSSGDKTKLDGIATGATKVIIDTALNGDSTNPVQNKVINTALAGKAASSHNHSASNITSGTLSIARGGTGGSTVSTALQNLNILPIGSSGSSEVTPNVPESVSMVYRGLSYTGLSTTSITAAQLIAKIPIRTSIYFSHISTDSVKITDAPTEQGVFHFYKGNDLSDCYVEFTDRTGKEYISSHTYTNSTSTMTKWLPKVTELKNDLGFLVSSTNNDIDNSPVLGIKTSFKTIQAIINLLPRNLGGRTVRIQMNPNTTTTDGDVIYIENFYNGRLDIMVSESSDTGDLPNASYPIINSNIFVRHCMARIVFRKVQIKGKVNGTLSNYSNSVITVSNTPNIVFDTSNINALISGTSKIDNAVLMYSSDVVFRNCKILNAGETGIRVHNNADYGLITTCSMVNTEISACPTGIRNVGGIFTLFNSTFVGVTTQTVVSRAGQIFKT